MQRTADAPTTAARPAHRLRSAAGNRTVAAIVVAVVLVALSFLNDPAGYLGTDTGGKTATLEAMVRRGDWSVDVGYWAETADPEGRYHPLYNTEPRDDGWVQVTSLPMVLAARPLYDLGGYRAALLLPIAGTVLAALAAAALASRLGTERDGVRAMWLFGLGSPLVVYALDLWEHSLGVAAVGWATVLLVDAARGPSAPGAARAAAAGALLAVAATMRTEAFVYSLVLVGATCLWILARRAFGRAVLAGISAVVGFTTVWLLNGLLEAAVGGNSRTSRATGAASGAAAGVTGSGEPSQLGERLEEGLRTTFATAATGSWTPVLLGVLLSAAVAAVAWAADRVPADRLRWVVVALGCFTVLTVAPGLGFVPGLFAAFPVAAAGLAVNRLPSPGRLLAAAALAALPVVWAFQFIGGAGPQWGGRYVLSSAFLLGVAGVVALGRPEVPRAVAGTVLAMCVAVTVLGVAWLHDRSHAVADLFEQVVAVQSDALISRNPFFLREAGSLALDHRWLSAQDPADLDGPAQVLADLGIEEFSVLQTAGWSTPGVPGADVVGVDRFVALGAEFEVVHLKSSR